MKPVLPGSTLGILGSGQLGRMLALEARRMGYCTHVFSPDAPSPAGAVADAETVADYGDLAALERFAGAVNVITLEFENVPADTVRFLEERVPVRPGERALFTAQNRLREKTFLAEKGFPVAPFIPVKTRRDLERAASEIGLPAILKTAGFGYDGKGQVKLERPDDLAGALDSLNGQEAVLEAFIPFDKEISVVGARGLAGSFAHYGALENMHRQHILDLTLAPASVPAAVSRRATELCREVMAALEVVGVLCVEFFLQGDRLIINELAPRPHNSGHFSLGACVTSQFEQQLRAVCGLPLGDTAQLAPAAMVNLLGDLWAAGEPDWAAALGVPGVALHLYGKAEARPGRKMGHLTAVAPTLKEAQARALEARAALIMPKP